MALTTEQQTSHLSRLQQTVLSWDYFTMDDGQTRSDATRKRALRDVPKTFASVNEYLDVFEPLVLEECAAQISRGDEEETRRSGRGSPIGAVFRSTRVDGFHVVQFILGEDQMAGFHDNDLILVSKTDPNDGASRTRARSTRRRRRRRRFPRRDGRREKSQVEGHTSTSLDLGR
jgi:senataxin